MSLAQSPPVSEVPPPGGAAPAHTNRLAKQSSPYLLQHAHNPVDWWPWGEEAFAEAKRRNVPIFLSVGYSTCYWCHVMERECFENEAIAKLLNENFVCIKVDREERPDVDDIYMTAVQLMTHRGGWPMTVWLTPPGARNETDPGLEPFYAGTYFPPESKYGVPGLPDVVGSVAEAWKSQHQQVLDQAAQVAGALREHAAHETTTVRLGHLEIGKAANALLNIHDTKEGGFGNPPKFPQPVFLEFLLELDGRINEPAVSGAITSAIRLTLDKMALGGMYDQVGGGFHRYSTDAKWLVPHFEKMLYDNAQLAAVYARSYAMRRDPFDARILSETLDYVLKEMLDKETGAFHSAQDAEVDEREGLNYLWTKQQIMETLGEADGKLACTIYGLDQGTNFKDPHHPEDGYKNVLFMEKRPEAFAAELKMTPDALRAAGERIDAKLYDARRTRKQPSTDDKVITSWNGLMIAALADGSLVLGQPKYLDAAERASRFFLVNMRTRTGGVFRTYRDTKAKTAGFLEDFSFLIKGLLAVHRAEAAYARADLRYLKGAEELTRVALERFGSESTPGALFDTRDAQPDLIVRSRSLTDGALPSGQSVMIHNLLDLYEITRDKTYLDRAVALIGSMSPEIAASPLSTVNATRAIMRLLGLAPQRLAELGPDRSNEAGEGPTVDADSPVKVHASTDRIAVPSGKEGATLHLRLEIEPGHHINAHEPGVPGMTGLDIRIEGGTGVKLAANWPKAEAYKGHALPEGEGPLMVHAGEVEFDVVLSRTEDAWSGRPLVVVTYQVCTDRECLAPTTVSLDVALDPG